MAYICGVNLERTTKTGFIQHKGEICQRKVRVGGTKCCIHDGRKNPEPITVGELELLAQEISPRGRQILRRLIKELLLFRKTKQANNYVQSIP